MTSRGCLRFITFRRFACIQAVILSVSALARAEDAQDARVAPSAPVVDRPHRIPFSIGYAAADGNSDIEGDHRVAESLGSLRAGYAYRLLSFFEAGADLSYWTTMSRSSIQAAIPSAVIRPFLPFGSRVEVGVTGRAGVLLWPQTGVGTGAWIGPAFSGGPDVRVWIDDSVGLLVSGDATIASGTGPGVPNAVNERAWFAAAGVFAGAVARL
jgi:hypothetical protein